MPLQRHHCVVQQVPRTRILLVVVVQLMWLCTFVGRLLIIGDTSSFRAQRSQRGTQAPFALSASASLSSEVIHDHHV